VFRVAYVWFNTRSTISGFSGGRSPAATPDIPATIKVILEDKDMNKSELIDAVASEAELSKADAARATDAVFDTISNALGKGDQVTLVGFGTFSVRERAARTGRNPQTGETIDIKASKTPGFKAGKALKDAVN
jgi:DNA-binding protein HU-beta